MKTDPLCARCERECKQPPAARLVSCPQFRKASRNLDLFNMDGSISAGATRHHEKARKGARNKEEDGWR